MTVRKRYELLYNYVLMLLSPVIGMNNKCARLDCLVVLRIGSCVVESSRLESFFSIVCKVASESESFLVLRVLGSIVEWKVKGKM